MRAFKVEIYLMYQYMIENINNEHKKSDPGYMPPVYFHNMCIILYTHLESSRLQLDIRK